MNPTQFRPIRRGGTRTRAVAGLTIAATGARTVTRTAAAALATTVMALATLATPTSAATVRGAVVDVETGEPMQLVSVTLGGEAYHNGTITTPSGRYRFVDVPAGRYVLRFSYVGYETRVETIDLADTDTHRLDVTLKADPIQVQEITVTTDRAAKELDIQTGYIELGREALMSVPAIGEPDPIRTLQFLPGVQAASDISSGLYVRGGGPDQTLILLDQIPLYNPTHAFGLFSTFNADAIDRTTLYKGAYPAEFGGRLGAVLDVQNREGDPTRLRGKVAVSTITGRAHLEGPFERGGSWMLSARRTYLEPILSAMRTDENPVPAYYFYDVNGKVRLTSPGSDKLVVTGYTGRDDLQLDLGEETYVNINWGNTAASIAYSHSYSPTLLGTVSLSGSQYRSITALQIFSTPMEFSNTLQDLTARSDLMWDGGGTHVLRGGVEASAYEFRFHQSFNLDTDLDVTSRPHGLSAYLQDEWRPGTGSLVRGGVRARWFSEGRRFFVEPRLSMSQVIGPFKVKAGGGVYNQILQLVSTEGFSGSDFYVPIDETATPSRSWQTVVGLDWNVSPQYQLSVEAYHSTLDDLVALDSFGTMDQTGVSTADIFRTGGEGYARGVELFAHRRMGSLTGWIGYTLGWTRRRFDELNQGREFSPKYDRRHDLNVVANYATGSWSFGGAFVYATGQAFTPAQARYDLHDPATGQVTSSGQLLPAAKNSARLLPYHRLDVNMSKRTSLFGRPAKWFVQVFNLYSRRNEWFVEYDTQNPDTEPKVVKQLPVIPSIGFSVDF